MAVSDDNFLFFGYIHLLIGGYGAEALIRNRNFSSNIYIFWVFQTYQIRDLKYTPKVQSNLQLSFRLEHRFSDMILITLKVI